jgi:hypothetical protein
MIILISKKVLSQRSLELLSVLRIYGAPAKPFLFNLSIRYQFCPLQAPANRLLDDVHGYKEIVFSILTTYDRQPISVEGRAPYESVPAQETRKPLR